MYKYANQLELYSVNSVQLKEKTWFTTDGKQEKSKLIVKSPET